MGNFLSIDKGNSRTKIVIWSDSGEPVYDTVLVDGVSMDQLEPLIEKYEVKSGAVAASGYIDLDFFSKLSQRLDGCFNSVSESAEISYNIIRSYEGKLGVDRFLNYLAVVDQFPYTGMLIVDAGSALTTDVVDSNCRFRGGNITPGYRMRLDCLYEKTAGLPLVSTAGHVRSFGINTESAIRSGVIMGMVAEIADAFERAKKKYKISGIIITGGDARFLIPHLEKKGLKIHHDPFLVCRGIYVQNTVGIKSPAYVL